MFTEVCLLKAHSQICIPEGSIFVLERKALRTVPVLTRLPPLKNLSYNISYILYILSLARVFRH